MPTLSQLQTAANQVKNETVTGANTATRVGGVLADLVSFLAALTTNQVRGATYLTPTLAGISTNVAQPA